jgi:Domain of unknown function (DUF4157)
MRSRVAEPPARRPRRPLRPDELDRPAALLLETIESGGEPLAGKVRDEMEARFAEDLRSVRVHTGERAEASARALDARALTVGEHVVFAAGAYAPDTVDGRRLLAHELAHVLRARRERASRAVEGGAPGDRARAPEPPPQNSTLLTALDERAAERTAGRAMAGASPVRAGISIEPDAPAASPERLLVARFLESRPIVEAAEAPASPLVETVAIDMARALEVDPTDKNGRVRRRVERMTEATRAAVVSRAQELLSPAQRERAAAALTAAALGAPEPAAGEERRPEEAPPAVGDRRPSEAAREKALPEAEVERVPAGAAPEAAPGHVMVEEARAEGPDATAAEPGEVVQPLTAEPEAPGAPEAEPAPGAPPAAAAGPVVAVPAGAAPTPDLAPLDELDAQAERRHQETLQAVERASQEAGIDDEAALGAIPVAEGAAPAPTLAAAGLPAPIVEAEASPAPGAAAPSASKLAPSSAPVPDAGTEAGRAEEAAVREEIAAQPEEPAELPTPAEPEPEGDVVEPSEPAPAEEAPDERPAGPQAERLDRDTARADTEYAAAAGPGAEASEAGAPTGGAVLEPVPEAAPAEPLAAPGVEAAGVAPSAPEEPAAPPGVEGAGVEPGAEAAPAGEPSAAEGVESQAAGADPGAVPAEGQAGSEMAAGAQATGDCGPDAAGEGGGGSAIEPEPEPEPPNVEGSEPAAAIAAVGSLPPALLQRTLGAVATAARGAVGRQRDALAAEPPSMERPSGSPETHPPNAAARAAAVVTRTARQAEEQVAVVPAAPTPADAPTVVPPPAPAPPTQRISTPAVGGNGETLSPADAQAMADSMRSLPTSDPGLEVDAGPAPTVALEGAADPARVDEQRAELEQSATAALESGRTDAAAPQGEDHIYPDVPAETLRAQPGEAGAAGAGGTGGGGAGAAAAGPGPGAAGPAAEGEEAATAAIAREQHAAQTQAAARQAGAEMTTSRTQQEESSQRDRESARAQAEVLVTQSAERQANRRTEARRQVTEQREKWRTEQDTTVRERRTEADTQVRDTRGKVTERQMRADREAAGHVEAGNRKVEDHRRDAERRARTERERRERESGGILDWVASHAKSFFDSLRSAIGDIFAAARRLVREAISAAQRAAAGVIDAARDAVVGFIRIAGAAVVAVGDRMLAAFPTMRARFRGAIQGVVERGVNAVNALADGLKAGIQELLNLLGRALEAYLNLLEQGYLLAVRAVESAVNSAITAARAIARGFAAFAVLIADVAANPGQWLRNLGASIRDGITNHLWPALKCAVKGWFNSKVEEILGLARAIFTLLRQGGIMFAEVGRMVWEAIKAALPTVVIQLLIEKLISLLVPAASAVMLIIDGLRAAWGAINRIIAAFEAFIAFLRAVKFGSAGRQFATMLSAAAVAVIDFMANFLLLRLRGPAQGVAGRLRAIAQRIGQRLRGVGQAIRRVGGRALAAVQRGARAATGAARAGGRRVAGAARTAGRRVAGAARAAGHAVAGAARAAGRGAVNVARRIGRGIASAGRTTGRGIARAASRRVSGLARAAASRAAGVARAVAGRVRSIWRLARQRFRQWRRERRRRAAERRHQRRRRAEERLQRALTAIRPQLDRLLFRGTGLWWLRLQLVGWRIRHLLSALKLAPTGAIWARVNPRGKAADSELVRIGTALERILEQAEREFLRLWARDRPEEAAVVDQALAALGRGETRLPAMNRVQQLSFFRRLTKRRVRPPFGRDDPLTFGEDRTTEVVVRNYRHLSNYFIPFANQRHSYRAIYGTVRYWLARLRFDEDSVLHAISAPTGAALGARLRVLRQRLQATATRTLTALRSEFDNSFAPLIRRIGILHGALETARKQGILVATAVAAQLPGDARATLHPGGGRATMQRAGAASVVEVRAGRRAAPGSPAWQRAQETAEQFRRERITRIFTELREAVRGKTLRAKKGPTVGAVRSVEAAFRRWLDARTRGEAPEEIARRARILRQQLVTFLQRYHGMGP